jgi:hypothetical protein
VATEQGLVDVGFIVCNDITYPNLLHFYKELNVPLDVTDMSFAISNPSTANKPIPNAESPILSEENEREVANDAKKEKEAFEWSFGNYAALPQMMRTRRFWSFVYSKWCFDRYALAFLAEHAAEVQQAIGMEEGMDATATVSTTKATSTTRATHADPISIENSSTHESFHASSNTASFPSTMMPHRPPTLSEFCARNGYSEAFMQGWLVPFCSAVWSAPHTNALDFEAHTMLAFLKNHGLLTMTPPTWYTPRGRTHVFLERMRAFFRDSGRAHIHTGQRVDAIAVVRGGGEESSEGGGGVWKRVQYRVTTSSHGNAAEKSAAQSLFPPHVLFDHVVMAVNSSEVPKLMATLAVDAKKRERVENGAIVLDGIAECLAASLTSEEDFLATLTPMMNNAALSGLRTFSNTCFLHADTSLMPRDRVHWASWNVYDGDALTYWYDGRVRFILFYPILFYGLVIIFSFILPLLSFLVAFVNFIFICSSDRVQRLQHVHGPDLFITLNPPPGWEERNHAKIKHKWTAMHPCLGAYCEILHVLIVIIARSSSSSSSFFSFSYCSYCSSSALPSSCSSCCSSFLVVIITMF